MALSDRTTTPTPKPSTGDPCSIGEVYRALADNPTELRALNTLLYEQGRSGSQVFTILTDEGFSIGAQTPNKHRGARCRCFTQEDWTCHGCRRDKPSCVCAVAA